MLSDHDLMALLDGTGVSKPASTAPDATAIWLGLLLVHGLIGAAAIHLVLLLIFN